MFRLTKSSIDVGGQFIRKSCSVEGLEACDNNDERSQTRCIPERVGFACPLQKRLSGASCQSYTLNRFLLIFRALILDSRVVRGIPSLSAAPNGPYTRPPHSLNASSMVSRSLEEALFDGSSFPVRALATGLVDIQLSSTEKVSRSHTMTERSITFCNSRIFPGQE